MAKNLGRAGQKRIQTTLEVLQKTASPKARNAAAIALADMKVGEAKDILLDLLRRPRTRGSRGTLLYALDEMGPTTFRATFLSI